MERQPTRIAVLAAFLAVYLIWGSTYLAIRVTLESLPPFLTSAARFMAAGALMAAWAWLRGAPLPTLSQWRAAFLVGGLLLLGGNGGVVFAVSRIPSGVVAVLVATVPLWFAMMDRRERTPLAPLALGFLGIVLLVGPSALGLGDLDPLGVAVVLLGSVCWAAGSLKSRSAGLPADPAMATGLQMLAGGALLAGAGLAAGEGALPVDPTPRALLAVLYLVVFGSLVGFSAYVWLLRHVPTRYVGTYAYVNPVIAVLLGWSFAGETLASTDLVAIGVVLASVVLLVTGRREPSAETTRPPEWLRRGRLRSAQDAA